ncbi:hypothetical protein SDC9_43303 [bioreactor metagenome]|uniref:Uncharacterized protein n=1 Tax=bioreactor metagenome TaxID=1076179 RepID=A0A644W043_9ZZZZ
MFVNWLLFASYGQALKVSIFIVVPVGIAGVKLVKNPVRGKARAGILGMLARVQNH